MSDVEVSFVIGDRIISCILALIVRQKLQTYCEQTGLSERAVLSAVWRTKGIVSEEALVEYIDGHPFKVYPGT